MPSNPRRIAAGVLAATALMLTAAPAQAVIKVKMPVARIYGTSKAVLVGNVTATHAATRVIDVAVVASLKGQAPGDTIRIQIVSPAALFGQVAAGRPVALFVGKVRGGSMAVLHLADTWLLAKRVPNTTPQVWRVVQKHDAKQTFPGRTAALVRLVTQIKGGKNTILDEMDVAFFRSDPRKLAKLNVTQPRWIMAPDVNADKKPDLLIGAAGGVRLLLAAAGGYSDATDKWQLRAGNATYRALGDVNGDGKVDLLLGATLWINDGTKFAPTSAKLIPPKGNPLAAAIADVNGDKKPDALFLTAAGELGVLENTGSPNTPWRPLPHKTLWSAGQAPVAAYFGHWGDTGRPHVLAVRESGITRYALDAAGGPPADFERLTGVDLPRYYERYRNGFKNPQAVVLDVNGDGRRDMLTVCDTGGLLLVNRGFGTFLCNYDAGGPVAPHAKKPPILRLSARTPCTSADLHNDGLDDLLVVTPDGTLYEVPNRPRKSGATQK